MRPNVKKADQDLVNAMVRCRDCSFVFFRFPGALGEPICPRCIHELRGPDADSMINGRRVLALLATGLLAMAVLSALLVWTVVR